MMRSPSNGKPVSVVLVCHSYPPVLGGSELEAQRVCAALIQRGYRIRVVCAGGHPMPPLRDWIDPKGVPVRIYAARWKGAWKDIVFALRVAGMLVRERREYQLVYFLMQGLHLAAGLPVARVLKKPILMKVSGSSVITLLTGSLAGRIELRWLRKWAYRVMILNDGMRAEALRAGFDPARLHWMPNPVDTGEFSPCGDAERFALRERFGVPHSAMVVLYCGRLAPEKALPSLLEAFARVVTRVPDAMLLLVGDGPLRAALTNRAAELAISERVVLTGRVEADDVRSWMQIADVFTLVSVDEGFPLALSEAMSVGLPSVVSDIPANRQLIEHGTHGLLAPCEDAAAIATSLITLLDDPGLRARMGHAARQRVLENYSTGKIADRYEALFHAAIAESG